MKAYKTWDSKRVEVENFSTVVFAETAQKARTIAMTTDACEDAAYTDIRVIRLPEMDCHYRGHSEIDWYDMEDRKALVSIGWACLETSWECDTCLCKPDCLHWQDDEDGF